MLLGRVCWAALVLSAFQRSRSEAGAGLSLFFFLILTSQSLLLEQLLSLQLLWGSMLLTELSRSCRWLISREGRRICLCANSV